MTHFFLLNLDVQLIYNLAINMAHFLYKLRKGPVLYTMVVPSIAVGILSDSAGKEFLPLECLQGFCQPTYCAMEIKS